MNYNFFTVILMLFMITSCTEVESGFNGVKYAPYGGGLETEKVYNEGEYIGLGWMWNDMITYETRQQAYQTKVTVLDKDGLDVTIEATLFFKPVASKIGELHLNLGQNYIEDYVSSVFVGEIKNTVGSYSAMEIFSKKREEAQQRIVNTLTKEYQKNNILCLNVVIKDVDLPPTISKVIVNKMAQDESNLLAEKKKLEEEYKAAAALAKAKGKFEAAEYEAKAKEILSQPKMLELYRAETDRIRAEKGVSEYGSNNVFGSQAMQLLLNKNNN